RCNACGHEVEALQKISDPALKDCPECREPSLQRLISAPAFRLKGGGWYETDFKSDKEKKRNLADSSSDAPKADKAEKSSGGANANGEAKGAKESKAGKGDGGSKAAAAGA